MNEEPEGFLGRASSIAVMLVILYFVWSARPAVDYYATLTDGLIRSGGVSALLGTLWASMGSLLVFTTILLIGVEFVDIPEASGNMIGMTFLWPVAGWYLGHDFNPSESPKLAYIGFSVLTLLLAFSFSIQLLGVVGRKLSGSNTSQENINQK